MKISVIIVSYNQAAFLEETLCSVIEQSHADKEIIVIDGNSTDGSIDIIRKYEDRLTHWELQRDKGQSAALVRGFALATGDVMGWVNSDDLLVPGALEAVAATAARVGTNGVFFGGSWTIDADSKPQDRYWYGPFSGFVARRLGPVICQPGTFWGRKSYQEIGGLNPSLRYGMDYDLFCRFLFKGYPFHFVGAYTGEFRKHPLQKGHSQSFFDIMLEETALTQSRYGMDKVSPLGRVAARAWQVVSRIFNGYYARMYSFRLLQRGSLREFNTAYSNAVSSAEVAVAASPDR